MTAERRSVTDAAERIHYVDWLRVLIVYGIALYHCALVFSGAGWLVVNRQSSVVFAAFCGFTFMWGIPAMFLIAGAGSWLAFQRETWKDFVRARAVRLFVPLVIGIALLTPLQLYLVSRNPPPSLGELPSFYSAFFGSLQISQAPRWLLLYGLHLWFLGYLLAVSLICLPVLVWMRDGHSAAVRRALLQLAQRRGGVLVLGLPLVLSQGILRHSVAQYQGWADVGTYAAVFLLGALLLSDRRFETAVRRNTPIVLGCGVVTAAAIAGMLLVQKGTDPNLAQPPRLGWIFGAVWGLNTWCWLVALLDLGIRVLDRPSRAIRWANDSTLPFYVIHHPVVLGVASFVVTWETGIEIKFAVIVIAVYAITLGVYDVAIRRVPPMRRLFGLPARPRGTFGTSTRRRGAAASVVVRVPRD